LTTQTETTTCESQKHYSCVVLSSHGLFTLGVQGESFCAMSTTCTYVFCAVPIDDAYLLSVSPYEADEYRIGSHGELMLQQYEQWGIVCVTSAATFAAPNVTVTVARRDVTRDITELFARSVDRRPVLLEPGLTRQHVTVRLEYVTSQPEPEMNGKTLTCTAAGQPGFDDVSATAVLIVNCTY